MEHFAIPDGGRCRLLNARVPVALCDGLALRGIDAADGLATTDLTFAAGRIEAQPAGPADLEIDLAGRLVLPGFVDMHVHLDKAFTVQRTGMSSGSLPDAVRLSMADAPNRTEADLRQRMTLGLRRAHAHGTVALRTHLDTHVQPDDSPAWRVFAELRDDWRGRLQLQGVALMAVERAGDDDFADRCAQIARLGGIAGAFVSTAPQTVEPFLASADRHGLDVDFHVDETLDAQAGGLEAIADAVLRTGFGGRVVVGHCCALAAKPRDAALRIIDKVARAGLHVVSLPLTNLFLMDRAPDRTPTWRGLTLVQEMRAQGVAVSFASDNVRDPFFPHGDFDMLEVLRSAARTAHLEARLGRWIDAVLSGPAAAMGIAAGRFAAGAAADAVVFRARDWIDLMSRPHADRLIIRNGAPLGAAAPDFDDLNISLEAR